MLKATKETESSKVGRKTNEILRKIKSTLDFQEKTNTKNKHSSYLLLMRQNPFRLAQDKFRQIFAFC